MNSPLVEKKAWRNSSLTILIVYLSPPMQESRPALPCPRKDLPGSQERFSTTVLSSGQSSQHIEIQPVDPRKALDAPVGKSPTGDKVPSTRQTATSQLPMGQSPPGTGRKSSIPPLFSPDRIEHPPYIIIPGIGLPSATLLPRSTGCPSLRGDRGPSGPMALRQALRPVRFRRFHRGYRLEPVV